MLRRKLQPDELSSRKRGYSLDRVGGGLNGIIGINKRKPSSTQLTSDTHKQKSQVRSHGPRRLISKIPFSFVEKNRKVSLSTLPRVVWQVVSISNKKMPLLCFNAVNTLSPSLFYPYLTSSVKLRKISNCLSSSSFKENLRPPNQFISFWIRK